TATSAAKSMPFPDFLGAFSLTLFSADQKGEAADSHIPQFGCELPFEGVKKVKENAPKKSGKGMLFAALVAVTALLAAGAWWYKSHQAGGVLAGVFSRQAPVASAMARAKPDRSNANVPGNAAPA